MDTIFITGGLGFIGTALVKKLMEEHQEYNIVVIDIFSYASNKEFYEELKKAKRTTVFNMDINNQQFLYKILKFYNPIGIIHLAAQSHVDNSIKSSKPFMYTNVIGTYNLLQQSRKYIEQTKREFKFLYVSTDEVYGDLPLESEQKFNESSNLKPSSPYSASKACGDLLVNAWHKTYNLPTLITHCSNNFGPYQNEQKLIPKIIKNILQKKDIPIYGQGKNIRDWIYVEDHINGILKVFFDGKIGQTYNIGSNNQKSNIDIVNTICEIMQKKLKLKQDPKQLIKFVQDRKGHDLRYAIDNTKIKELGWSPNVTFKKGLQKTITWYLQKYGILKKKD